MRRARGVAAAVIGVAVSGVAALGVAALGVAVLAVAVLAVGCGPQTLDDVRGMSHDTGVKVLLVGIDGATFTVLEPLMERGELPVMSRLVADGAAGPLLSIDPMLSPSLWTTVVTGRSRRAHGVKDFLVRGPRGREVVSSNERKVQALWTLAPAFGHDVGFLGWWASWPAEPVHGFLVSDRMTRARWLEWHDGGRSTWRTFPPDLAEELESLVVDPLDPPLDEIAELVELDDAELEEFLEARKPLMAHGPSVFKFAYASQRSYERMALHLLETRGQPDLTGVFLIANDAVSHTFWHYYEPSRFDGVDPDKAARLGALIPAMSRHNDRYLEQLLAAVDPETVVLIVSDHGFQASGRLPRPAQADEVSGSFSEEFSRRFEGGLDTDGGVAGAVTVGQSGVHDHEGVLIASGGPIAAGVRVEASLLDVTPTVLALLGLPVAENMPGRVLTEVIDPAFLERYPVRTIASYEDILERVPIATDGTPDDQESLEMLRALGYIQ